MLQIDVATFEITFYGKKLKKQGDFAHRVISPITENWEPRIIGRRVAEKIEEGKSSTTVDS